MSNSHTKIFQIWGGPTFRGLIFIPSSTQLLSVITLKPKTISHFRRTDTRQDTCILEGRTHRWTRSLLLFLHLTQRDPRAYRPDPTQPILPTHGTTQPTHSTAKQIEALVFNIFWRAQYEIYCFG